MDVPTKVKNKKLVETRREQIVLAAIKLFSENGFHGTTLRQLAEESGLSYGNIYDYVGSKEDIFSLIHDFVANRVMKTLLSSIENTSDPIERLRRIVRGEFNVMDQWSDAILLLYQESHILAAPYLHKLLKKERQHLELIENVIDQAISAGRLKECNSRLTANLIKSMVDSWVIKRWDLRGYATRLEAEKVILDFVFHGLLDREEKSASQDPNRIQSDARNSQSFQGKNIFIANGGTVLGSSICNDLLAKNASIAIHSEPTKPTRENPTICADDSVGVKKFQTDQHGYLTPDLFRKIEADLGQIDIFIHDLGIGTLNQSEMSREQAAARLAANLKAAEEFAEMLTTQPRRQPNKVVFLAPWGWDRGADPFRFQTVRAGIIALTKLMGESVAPKGISVNCIVPGYIRAARPSSLEKAMRDELLNEIPAGSLGETADVTETVNYLISDAAKYVTGQVIEVSGGLAWDHQGLGTSEC